MWIICLRVYPMLHCLLDTLMPLELCKYNLVFNICILEPEWSEKRYSFYNFFFFVSSYTWFQCEDLFVFLTLRVVSNSRLNVI